MTDLDSVELKQKPEIEEVKIRLRAYAEFHLDLRTPMTPITFFRKVLSILRINSEHYILFTQRDQKAQWNNIEGPNALFKTNVKK